MNNKMLLFDYSHVEAFINDYHALNNRVNEILKALNDLATYRDKNKFASEIISISQKVSETHKCFLSHMKRIAELIEKAEK